MKPHKGSIVGKKLEFSPQLLAAHNYHKSLSYIVVGQWEGHPQFGHSHGQTSLVMKKGRWKTIDGVKQCEIETLNSCYTWKLAA
jgi:hypothetical protein